MSVERFAANAIRSVAIGLMAIAPAVLLPAVYARTLPPAEVAAWLYAYGLGNYVTVLHLGIGTSISAQVARESTQAGRAAFLLAGIRLMVMVAIVAVTGILASGYFGLFDSAISGALDRSLWIALLASATVGTAMVLPLNAFSGYCVGTFNVARLVPVMVLQKSSLVLLCAAAAAMLGTAWGVSLAHLLSGVVTAALLMTMVRREAGRDLPAVRSLVRVRRRAILGLAVPAAISGFAQLPLINLHVLLVGRYVPDAIVSFVVVSSGLALLYGMAWSILGNLLPEFSARRDMASAGPGEEGAALLPPATYLCGLVLLASSGAVACGLPAMLTLAVTDVFARADLAGLVAYAIALIARLATLPWGLAFYAGGHPWAGLVPTLLEAATSATLAIVLLPLYGLSGLAVAVLVAALLHALVAWPLLGRCRLISRGSIRPLMSVGFTLLACGLLAAVCGVAWKQFVETTMPIGTASLPLLLAFVAGSLLVGVCWRGIVPLTVRDAVRVYAVQTFLRLRSFRRGHR